MTKYLKYKTKYLNLKNTLSVNTSTNVTQTGGNTNSIYANSIMELNNLTETPTYELEGGDEATPLSDKSLSEETAASASEQSEASDHSEASESEQSKASESEQSKASESEQTTQTGGSEFDSKPFQNKNKVSKKNKKNFFDDSDLESSSTDLSSLSSSDSESD
jgi:hypothetical protein